MAVQILGFRPMRGLRTPARIGAMTWSRRASSAVQGSGEPAGHAGQQADDLGEVLQAAAAAEFLGVVHGGLETQHVLALGAGLQLEPPEADPEPAEPVPWFLDHDLLRRRAVL